jgi:3alpha(or 20beta)-hydroxysteroid dehydrogenase
VGRLEGKVAIVTGAARGTGAATARLFAEEGARVLLADVLDDPARALAEELGDAAVFRHLDVREESQWRQAVDAVQRDFGALHVLVNNAAVLHMAALVDTSLDDWNRVVAVNQTGAFLGMRAVAGPMKAAGGGSIVNVSSIDGLTGMNGVAAYAASKWALRGMTRVAALELGRFGIRVNTVCPGSGSPDMIAPFVPRGGPALEKLAKAPPMSILRPASPPPPGGKIGAIARAIAFLASDDSSYCTGADLAVDGGYTAGKLIEGLPGSEDSPPPA